MTIRKRVWQILEPAKAADRASKIFDIAILTLIAANVAAVMVGTVASVEQRFGAELYAFEVFSVAVFTIEYTLRIWSCVSKATYRNVLSGRLRFALTPMALIDLVAILPFYVGWIGFDLRFLRALRLLRLVRIAKVARYMNALQIMSRVLRAKREELLLTAAVTLLLLIMAASLMYQVEHDAQPEVFSSIPATMWWAIATLTTVGYGDVYPITPMGQVVASVVAILGVGLFALPTGIIGAGFVEEIQRLKTEKRCPHCGELL